MAYIPDPTDLTQPTDSVLAETAQAEFRALKAYIAVLTGLNTGAPLPASENAIIGGDFSTNPWQRGTSFAVVATPTYTADRWSWRYSGAGLVTISKSADAPTVAQAGKLITDCMLIDCTTVDAAIAPGDIYSITQFVEGYNFRPLAQRSMALQFWHKHTRTGIYSVSLRNSASDRSYVAEYTQALVDTWELATIIISASPSAGTWDYTNGIGVSLDFCVAGGTTFQTLPTSWTAGNFLCSPNQVNGLDNVANNFRIAGVDLRPGSAVLPVVPRSIQQELALCQRYYNKTFNIGTAPVQNAGLNTGEYIVAPFAAGAATMRNGYKFPVPMRAAPTLTFFNPEVANAQFRDQSAGADCSATAASNINENEALISCTGNAGSAVGNRFGVHITSSAEL